MPDAGLTTRHSPSKIHKAVKHLGESIRLTLDFERPRFETEYVFTDFVARYVLCGNFSAVKILRNCSISLKYELSVFSDTFFFFFEIFTESFFKVGHH